MTAFKMVDSEWIAAIPSEEGTLLGRGLSIHVDRKRGGRDGMAPDDFALIQTILGSLPKLLERATQSLKEYELKDPSSLNHVRSPHIWFTGDEVEDRTKWTIVVGRDDQSDFGWHIEFRGTNFVEIWPGS